MDITRQKRKILQLKRWW